jgi:hypothetical protein
LVEDLLLLQLHFSFFTDYVESKSKDSSLESTGEREPQEADRHLSSKCADSDIQETVDHRYEPSVIELIASLSLDEFIELKILSQQQQQHQQLELNHTTTSESNQVSNDLPHLSLGFQQLFSRNDNSWNAVITDYLHDAISNDNYDDDECGSIHSFDSLEYYDRKGKLLVPLKSRKDN